MRDVESTDVPDSTDVDTLRSVLRERPVELAVLFGSHATGTPHSTSDVDIAVQFESSRRSDPDYNETFLGLGADLSAALDTNDVDLVDLETVSPTLADSIFARGVLVVGDRDRAIDVHRRIRTGNGETQSPRERIDAALAKIDAHLDGDGSSVPVSGESATRR